MARLPRWGRAPVFVFALAAGVAGCGAGSEVVPGEHDDFGHEVAPGRAQRIASLNPSATEILFALGVGPRLIGRTSWDLYSDSVRLVPDMGSGIRPNIELVVAARPDLVVLYAGEDNRPAADRFRALGIRTLSVKNDSIGDFTRTIRLLGMVAGASDRAVVVRDSVLASLERVRRATSALPRRTAFWYIWDVPLISVGRGSYLSELLDIAGARNVYHDVPTPSANVTLEDVVRRDPYWIVAGPDGTRKLGDDARWQALSAVKARRVVTPDTALVARPGVRLGEAAVSLARLLHPGIDL